ncbi:hypothetical protein BC835DRAFT_830074 [Cytidiella melzeri]|nr:hypothetical protein BC835DRAFT_830074 [Cytidiella melzeri]
MFAAYSGRRLRRGGGCACQNTLPGFLWLLHREVRADSMNGRFTIWYIGRIQPRYQFDLGLATASVLYLASNRNVCRRTCWRAWYAWPNIIHDGRRYVSVATRPTYGRFLSFCSSPPSSPFMELGPVSSAIEHERWGVLAFSAIPPGHMNIQQERAGRQRRSLWLVEFGGGAQTSDPHVSRPAGQRL